MAGTAAAVVGIAGPGAALAGGAAAASAAGAAAPRYSVATAGTGLEIQLGGTTFAGAVSAASAGTGAPVTARGQGEASPSATATAQASAASPGVSSTRPRTCAQPTASFPAPFSTLVQLGVACGTASASMHSTGMPTASGAGSVGSLTVGAPPGTTFAADLGRILPTTVTQGSGLAQKLQTVLGSLPTLPTTGLPLGTVLQKVASATSGTSVTSLVSASVGPSTSTVATTGSTITAASSDTGSTVGVLNGLGAGGGALLTVTVGKALSSAHADLATATTGASATGGAVSVTFSPPTGTSKTVALAPGASQSFLTGTPLQTSVAVGASAATARHGTASAEGVTIHLAQGVGTGGIVLVLGASTAKAAVTAPPVVTTPTTPPPPAAAPVVTPAPATLTGATTVHTGEPWSGTLPFVLLGFSLLAGVGLITRRRLLALAHLGGHRAVGTGPASGLASRRSAGPGLRDLLRSPSGSGSGPAAHRTGGPGGAPAAGDVAGTGQGSAPRADPAAQTEP